MRLLCAFGIHKKYLMPWVIERDSGSRGPEYVCKRCGKLYYSWVLRVLSPERPLFSSPWVYEFQPPPRGHDTWESYHTSVQQGIKDMVARLREQRK